MLPKRSPNTRLGDELHATWASSRSCPPSEISLKKTTAAAKPRQLSSLDGALSSASNVPYSSSSTRLPDTPNKEPTVATRSENLLLALFGLPLLCTLRVARTFGAQISRTRMDQVLRMSYFSISPSPFSCFRRPCCSRTVTPTPRSCLHLPCRTVPDPKARAKRTSSRAARSWLPGRFHAL